LVFVFAGIGPTLQQTLEIARNDVDFDVNPGTRLIVLENGFLLRVRHDVDVKAVAFDAVY
jgi:hypothetical protein